MQADCSKIFLGMGSNQGDPAGHLEWAIERLRGELENLRYSSFYTTSPRDDEDQPRFVNCVVTGECRMAPEELLRRVLSLETERGRMRDPSRPKGPRPLDIDVLLWGDRVIDTPDLQVPHPRMPERLFVLIPLLELDPFAVNPVSQRPFGDYRKVLEPQGIYYFNLTRYIGFNERNTPGRKAEL